MNNSEKKVSFGQSLVEVVIALTVLSIVLSGLVKTVTISLKNIQYSRNKNFSLHLVQKKIEDLHQERDSQPWETFWGEYVPSSGTKLVTESSLDETGTPNPTRGIFTRSTTYINASETPTNKDKMKTEVVVSWSDGQKTYTNSSTIILTKWRD